MLNTVGLSISDAFTLVQNRVASLAAAAARQHPVRIVAVSKTKPAADILELYNSHGHRDFGENYVQELSDKARNLPPDIRWRFIGHLQSNKCKSLVSIPNLQCIETIDSTSLASQLQKEMAKLPASDRRLDVMIQVNTSLEDSKSGVDYNKFEEIVSLARFIQTECGHLNLTGLMTVGAPTHAPTPSLADINSQLLAAGTVQDVGGCVGVIAKAAHADVSRYPLLIQWYRQHSQGSSNSSSSINNRDFQCLRQVRDGLAAALQVAPSSLELSMGMSGDFEAAIVNSSDSIRIGSLIFQPRETKS